MLTQLRRAIDHLAEIERCDRPSSIPTNSCRDESGSTKAWSAKQRKWAGKGDDSSFDMMKKVDHDAQEGASQAPDAGRYR